MLIFKFSLHNCGIFNIFIAVFLYLLLTVNADDY